MPSLKLAYVNFFKECRGRRIVSINDIVDLPVPVAHTDFDEDRTYKVTWPHQPTDTSFSTEGQFDAKICCLGENLEDILHETKVKGLKPPVNVADYENRDEAAAETTPDVPVKVSSKGRSLKRSAQPSTESIAPPARSKKKKKPKLADIVKDKRSKGIIDDYVADQNLPFPKSSQLDDCAKLQAPEKRRRQDSPKKSDSKNMAGEKPLSNDTALSVQVPSKKRSNERAHSTGNSSTSSGDRAKNQAPAKVSRKAQQQDTPLKSEDIAEDEPLSNYAVLGHQVPFKKRSSEPAHSTGNSFSSSGDRAKHQASAVVSRRAQLQDTPLKLEPKSAPAEPDSEEGDDKKQQDMARKSHFDQPLLRDRVLSKKQSNDLAHSTDNSSTSSDYVPSDAEKDLFYNKVLKLEDEKRQLKASKAKLEEEVEDLRRALDASKESVNELRKDNSRLSRLNMNLAEQMVKKLSGSTSTHERKSPVVSSVLTWKSRATPEVDKRSPKKVSKKLFDSYSTPHKDDFENSDENIYAQSTISSPCVFSAMDMDSPSHVSAKKVPQSPINRSPVKDSKASPSKSPSKSAKQQMKKRKSNDLEDGIADNVSLEPMIYKAILGDGELQVDGAGKCHIGNNVWIKKSVFYDKISKPSVSPSIALRDALGNIYQTREMAERSLEGGNPVKSSGGVKKPNKMRMTPAKREAVLGLYRAKVKQTTGSSDKCFLDLSVSKHGRDTIRNKLKEADTLMKKKVAEQTSDKQKS